MNDPLLRLGRAHRDPGDLLVRRSASYGPDPTSARQARRLLQEALTAADRMRWADAGELALSEVVTNAALHAHTPFDVEIEVHADRLHVEVRDGNPMPPRQRGYDTQATTGRGLALVSALADECGVHSVSPAGKVVWFSLGDQAGATADAALAAAWGGAHGDDWLEGSWQDSAWDLEADPGRAGPAPGTRTVTLPSMPATLWLAAVQHHDALLRELVLYLAEHEGPPVDLALADAARGQVGAALSAAVEAAQRAGTARPPVPPGHPTPLPHVPDTLDLPVPVPAHAGASYAALQDALDVAERLAHAGRLLVRPGLPEIVEVRDWLCEQVVAQLAGVPAAPWPGTTPPTRSPSTRPPGAPGTTPWSATPTGAWSPWTTRTASWRSAARWPPRSAGSSTTWSGGGWWR